MYAYNLMIKHTKDRDFLHKNVNKTDNSFVAAKDLRYGRN